MSRRRDVERTIGQYYGRGDRRTARSTELVHGSIETRARKKALGRLEFSAGRVCAPDVSFARSGCHKRYRKPAWTVERVSDEAIMHPEGGGHLKKVAHCRCAMHLCRNCHPVRDDPARPGESACAGPAFCGCSPLDMSAIPSMSADQGSPRATGSPGQGLFDPGPIDGGVIGPRDGDAVGNFQDRSGIETSAKIDNQTLYALGAKDLEGKLRGREVGLGWRASWSDCRAG